MIIREATLADIRQMQVVRNAVKENRLSDPSLVPDKDYEAFISHRGKGWLCEIDKQVVGFAFADLEHDNIWALFVHPDHEGKGAGKQLHLVMLDWYFAQQKDKVWLSTAPFTRAELFYRKAGWAHSGMYGKEIRFEMTRNAWEAARSKAGH